MLKVLRCMALLAVSLAVTVHAEELSAIAKAKVSVEVEKAKSLAADPVIVKAVKEFNANKPAPLRGMTQTKWEALAATDSIVTGLASNAVAKFIKSHVDEMVSEAFLSGADGTKVALLAKTTNWNHTGAAKFEDPMQGKTWQGSAEKDLSTDVLQLQIAVPVLDEGKSIGVLVIGLKVRDLASRHATAD